MNIKAVELNHFRNFESLTLFLSDGVNVFFGDNAQGKTNILESVYVSGTTKSHRMSKDREMIRFGQNEAHIRTELTAAGVDYRVDMHLKKNTPKGIAINGVPIRKASELLQLGHYVFFSPEDLGIIKNGPGERRRFLDMELCQIDRSYMSALAGYNKTLIQRNALLKDLSFRPELIDTLDIWDMQLCLYAQTLIRAREDFTGKLGRLIEPIHSRLSGGREQLKVVYEKNVEAEEFPELLQKNRDKDIRFKSTSVGPHRDDLMFVSNGVDLRHFGSQGQQRTAALSLKLSEIELVREASEDTPVLLLDDVLSELDKNRQKYLLESMERVQTLITCTGMEDFTDSQLQIDRLFYVKEGTIKDGRKL